MKNIAVEKKEYFLAIVDAVCYWLGYQNKIGRKQLIHEASLRYPIADIITAKGISINRLVLEYLHPLFYSKKIDLVILEKDILLNSVDNIQKNVKEVFEFKLAKYNTGKRYTEEHQRVFDDIVRLAYFNLWENKECYFLMCGEFEDFKTFFVGQGNAIIEKNGKNSISVKRSESSMNKNELGGWKPNGIYKDWFDFRLNESKEKKFHINDHSTWGLINFQKNYKKRENIDKEFINHLTIKTTCLGITPLSHEKTRTHAAGIWKIEAL